MEALLCEYEEGTKKANSDMYVEVLPLEEDAEKSNNNKNIYAVSTEDINNARSETLEALRTEYDTKYTRIDNMAQEDVDEATNEFDICNPKLSREGGFWT